MQDNLLLIVMVLIVVAMCVVLRLIMRIGSQDWANKKMSIILAAQSKTQADYRKDKMKD